MKHFFLLLLCFFASKSFAQPGSLDPSFGTAGKTIIPMAESAEAIAVKPNGKIILAGSLREDPMEPFGLTQLNADGSLDNSFGGDGLVTTQFVGVAYETAYAIGIQTDGKILVAGFGEDDNGDNLVIMARYRLDGSLDSTFDEDGKVITDVGASDDLATSVNVLPDGKILLVGQSRNTQGTWIVMELRYNTNGSLDTSFGNAGIVLTPIGSPVQSAYINGAVIQSDGKIVVVGSLSSNVDALLVLRFQTNGSLDPTFDGDGIVIIPNPNGGSSGYSGYSCALQPDGKIVAAGVAGGSTNLDFLVARLNPNGSLDPTFSSDGIQTTSFGAKSDWALSTVVQSDGKILVGGYAGINSANHSAIARYNPDGSLDNSFDGDGKLTTDWGTNYDGIAALAMQTDGKILAAGYYDDGNHLLMSIARYISGLSVGVIDAPLAITSRLIYPNPIQGQPITIEYQLPTPSPVHIELLDLQGKALATLLDEERFSGQHTESLTLPSGLASGYYLLNIRTERGNTVVKIEAQNH